jgi:tellurite resistance protein
MQAEDAQPGNNAPKEDWFSTHPFSPLRVKALKLFDQSELSRTSGTSKTDLEIAVQGLMSFMEPSYLEGQSETAIHMKRLLYTGAIMVADASDGISDEEIKVFEEFFGKREFSDHLDIQKLKDSLDERIKNVVNTATMTQRMQIINDLSLVSKASGDVTASEKQVMQKIAVALEVPLAFVCQTLDQNCEPD